MYDLIPYLLHRIQSGGTAVVPSGRDLVRTYGEFSEVPPGIGGPSYAPRLGHYGGIQPYVHNGEVQPPPRETNGKPATRMGPLIEGEAIRPVAGPGAAPAVGSAAGGSLATMANPLLAAVMGSIQGDVLPNKWRKGNGPDPWQTPQAPPPAPPAPQAQGVPPVQPMDMDSGGQPAPPISTDNSPPQFQPQPTQPMPPVQGFDMNGLPTHVPMPQPRPQMAPPQQVPMPHARPAAAPAPQPQQMSWFMRNALMQKDPITGQFIDPAGAARAMAQFK